MATNVRGAPSLEDYRLIAGRHTALDEYRRNGDLRLQRRRVPGNEFGAALPDAARVLIQQLSGSAAHMRTLIDTRITR